jgi:hypothetical protein
MQVNDLPLTIAPENSDIRPLLVWNGNEYGAVWREDQSGTVRNYFARLDATGTKIGEDVELSPGNRHSLVWTGTEYAIAYRGSDGIMLQRLDALGNPIDGASVINPIGLTPALTWTGAEYGVAWVIRPEGEYAVEFARADASGQLIPDSKVTVVQGQAVSHEDTRYDMDLAWGGGRFGLVYTNVYWVGGIFYSDEIYFQALDSVGNTIGDPLHLTDHFDDWIEWLEPRITWGGSEFCVAWSHGWRSIMLDRIDGSGNKIGSTEISAYGVTQELWPALTWTGAEYGLIWMGYVDQGELFFARMDSSGDELFWAQQVVGTDQVFFNGSIAWTGAEYGIVWHGQLLPGGETGIHFARLSCGPCVDGDGDGATSCEDCDDTEDTIYPGAPQLCNGVNDDCSDPDWPAVSDDEIDNDRDDFAECDGDCNDHNDDMYPGAPQLCNGVNDDCSDPDWPAVPADEIDLDDDGFAICNGECDDADRTVYPGAPQLCDGINNDCNDAGWPIVSGDEIDDDGDGFAECAGDCDDANAAANPSATEVCNGIDDDCDGLVDEDAAGEDTDGDGVHNLCDNCPTVANRSQNDRDGDGIGDRCDLDRPGNKPQ